MFYTSVDVTSDAQEVVKGHVLKLSLAFFFFEKLGMLIVRLKGSIYYILAWLASFIYGKQTFNLDR